MRKGGDGYTVFRDYAINPYNFGPPLALALEDYIRTLLTGGRRGHLDWADLYVGCGDQQDGVHAGRCDRGAPGQCGDLHHTWGRGTSPLALPIRSPSRWMCPQGHCARPLRSSTQPSSGMHPATPAPPARPLWSRNTVFIRPLVVRNAR